MLTRVQPWLAVGAGGAVGAVSRWGLVSLTVSDWEALLIAVINVVGSLLLGGLIAVREQIPRLHYLALGPGFTGGFTTFAGFAVDVATRLDQGTLLTATANGLGTPLAAVLAAGIGYRTVRVRAIGALARRRPDGRRR